MIQTKDIRYKYSDEVILSFPDISCESGEAVLVLGQSGVGKTTLLHLMAGLLSIQEGSIHVGGQELSSFSSALRDQFRGEHIGLILQQSYFIASLNVLDNVVLGSYVATKKKDVVKAEELLKRLGVFEQRSKMPHELSVGQQQRVAIARALMNNPQLVLADEPTSALDDENTKIVSQLLLEVCKEYNSTLVVVTHDSRLKDYIDNQIVLR
ncbi:MAG: ABC transporter ATP-binding protein [Flavobacteriales bacterium]|nr:ABC transporter ATP-binding protein [Flavobacteriales bacterium]